MIHQLQRILGNMLLNPEELSSLRLTIDDLMATSSTSDVHTILLDFIARLEVLLRGDDWEDPPTIAECLQCAIMHGRHPVSQVPRLRQARKSNTTSYFPCLHVVVTPTRLILEGPTPEQVSWNKKTTAYIRPNPRVAQSRLTNVSGQLG